MEDIAVKMEYVKKTKKRKVQPPTSDSELNVSESDVGYECSSVDEEIAVKQKRKKKKLKKVKRLKVPSTPEYSGTSNSDSDSDSQSTPPIKKRYKKKKKVHKQKDKTKMQVQHITNLDDLPKASSSSTVAVDLSQLTSLVEFVK